MITQFGVGTGSGWQYNKSKIKINDAPKKGFTYKTSEQI